MLGYLRVSGIFDSYSLLSPIEFLLTSSCSKSKRHTAHSGQICFLTTLKTSFPAEGEYFIVESILADTAHQAHISNKWISWSPRQQFLQLFPNRNSYQVRRHRNHYDVMPSVMNEFEDGRIVSNLRMHYEH